MQRRTILSVLIATALLLSASLTPAADTKSGTAAETKATGAPKATEKSAKPAKAAAPAKLVDINGAGKKELMTLPGIGAAEAEKIIAGRPYGSKAHLVTRNILAQGVYENLKTLVIAKQKDGTPPKPATK